MKPVDAVLMLIGATRSIRTDGLPMTEVTRVQNACASLGLTEDDTWIVLSDLGHTKERAEMLRKEATFK